MVAGEGKGAKSVTYPVPECRLPLCVARNVQRERLLADVDTFKVKALEVQVVELKETVERLNRKIARRN